jgi:probable DNA metabolism protein
MNSFNQGDLFNEANNEEPPFANFDDADIALITALHSSTGLNLSGLPPHVQCLYEFSINAFKSIVYARMSALPRSAEIARYEHKVLEAANASVAVNSEIQIARRQAAETAAVDRGDSDTSAVLEAAYKVSHEIHRLMGLLRFSPNEDGIYIAHCEPDHFVLPALGPHFKERFGEIPWAIIDEKRRICMRCVSHSLEFCNIDKNPAFLNNPPDSEWENLWRHYHKTINNESRNNPDLQRRFMPKRYWKYLNELSD